MEQLPASKYGKPSAVIAGIELRRPGKFQPSTDLSNATQAVLKDYGIDKSSNGGRLTRPGTASRYRKRATPSVRGTVQTYDRFQGVDDSSWTDRLPHMVKVNDSVDVIDERTPSEAALASLRLTKGS
jgi:hypothetical protein